MTANPYRIEGPALVSFSGGRTSAYMLRKILDAYDGRLPDDVFVCFANTGKEREETLRFVHECATRWNVRVRWLEYRARPKGAEGRATPRAERFAEVGYNSASRNGEPLTALFDRKEYLPNGVTRFCTADGKIGVLTDFMLTQGFKKWTNVVGLRWDEMHRVFKQIARNESGKERWRSVMPMATQAAAVTRETVESFWRDQPFDLGLRPDEGNCDLCFLKGKAKLIRLIREDPSRAAWWIKAEAEARASKPSGATFHRKYSYADLVREARESPRLPIDDDGEEFDVECGLVCAGDEGAE
jgi:3'-phosphoadenosine 5'-phosphosulfate sulfotransferase (PAPS reductase)/FAD synthetase